VGHQNEVNDVAVDSALWRGDGLVTRFSQGGEAPLKYIMYEKYMKYIW